MAAASRAARLFRPTAQVSVSIHWVEGKSYLEVTKELSSNSMATEPGAILISISRKTLPQITISDTSFFQPAMR